MTDSIKNGATDQQSDTRILKGANTAVSTPISTYAGEKYNFNNFF